MSFFREFEGNDMGNMGTIQGEGALYTGPTYAHSAASLCGSGLWGKTGVWYSAFPLMVHTSTHILRDISYITILSHVNWSQA